MKTPRDILLACHRAAEPALDAIRSGVIASLAPAPEKNAARQPATFIEFLVSLRRHAAAMSALWLLAAILGRDHSAKTCGAPASSADSPPPLAYIFALHEYQKQLAELIDPPERRSPPSVPHACAPPRRRETDCLEIA